MFALKLTRRKLSPAFWVFVLVFGIRIFALIRLSNSPYFDPTSGDMKFYNDWALRISHGRLTDGQAFYGLPGYAYLLAIIYGCIGFDPFAVGVLQAIMEALTGVWIWKIACEVFPNGDRISLAQASLIGVAAAIGWAFFQPAQAFSIILMPTSWMVAAFWFCVWQLVKMRSGRRWPPWVSLGLFIGLVANVVATILFLIPLALVRIWTLFLAERATVRLIPPLLSSLLLIAATFTAISPCWIHNYFVAHEPVLLSAHSGVNFYIGNNPIATGYPKIPPGMRAGQEGMLKDSITMAEIAEGRQLRRFEVSRYWSAQANDYIHHHFIDWLRLMTVKLKNFWNAYQYDDLSLITLFKEAHIITPGLRFGVIAALGLGGMVLGLRKAPKANWVSGAVLLHMCALLPVFITERYRLAVVPGLLLMASYGLWSLWKTLVSENLSASLPYLALSAGAGLLVSWPQPDQALWSLDYYNRAIKEIEADNYGAAQTHLELAYAYVPENSEINFALGNVWLQRGDRERAKQFYRRAIEINARHSSAFNNLAVLAMQEQRWPLARTFLQRSLQIEPDDAKTHYLLAKTLLEEGDPTSAKAELAKALTLWPNQKEFLELQSKLTP